MSSRYLDLQILEKTQDLVSRSLLLLHLVVLQGSLNGILSKHGAVKLHWGEGQLLRDVAVLDLSGVAQLLTLDPLRSQAGRGDSRAAAEGLELGVHDLAVVVDLNLSANKSTGMNCY